MIISKGGREIGTLVEYDKDYKEGMTISQEELESLLNRIYAMGYETGHGVGSMENVTGNSFKEGYDEGYDDGYDEGYNAAHSGKGNNSWVAISLMLGFLSTVLALSCLALLG